MIFHFMNEQEVLQYDEKAKNVCAQLKSIREEKGMPINQLAEKSGLSWAGVMRIEEGERIPSLSTIMRIAASLEVELWKLIRDLETKM